MYDFSFNGVSLSSFGGRIIETPMHTIATRNKSLVKIYGQSGDEVIDNGSYNNVNFSVKIGFFTFVSKKTAEQLARDVIDWLAPLQDGYYNYRDTYNPGCFTRAVLTNFDEIVRQMRTFLTATLKFSRVPFWYLDAGTTEIDLASGGRDYTVTNPTAYESEPIYVFHYGRPNMVESAQITVNGTMVETLLSVAATNYYFDNVSKQLYVITDNKKNYVGTALLPNLLPGENTIRYRLNTMDAGSFYMTLTPNWRRL
jgi:phage-related protein